MRHYFTDVPGLGNVALSRHAQARAEAEAITERHVERALEVGRSTPEAPGTLWRDHQGVRLVIIRPTPWCGAWLVKTMFRIDPQAKAKS